MGVTGAAESDAPKSGAIAPGTSALLALDGELPTAPLLERLRREHAILVAADGAAIGLLDRGLVPDVVIGDLDSIGGRRHMFADLRSILIESPDQETNDFEKALRWLLDQGYRRATIVGFGGGMLDHTLNNASIAARYAGKIELRLVDDGSTGHVVRGELSLETAPGDRISLIPLPSARLTTRGLAWELADEILATGLREGASNRAVAGSVSIAIADGTVLLFHYPAAGAGSPAR